MKTTLLCTATIMLMASASVFAQNEPVIPASHCKETVHVPKDSNTHYYFSKDCKTVFVLPSTKNSVKVSNLEIKKDLSCEEYNTRNETLKQIMQDLFRLSEERMNFIVEMMDLIERAQAEEKIELNKKLDDDYAVYSEQINSLLLMQDQMMKTLGTLKGAEFKVNVKVDLEKEVEAFKKANAQSRLNFKPLPVKYGQVHLQDVEYISTSSIPALSTEDGSSIDSENLILKQGVEAHVTVSLGQVCFNENLNQEIEGVVGIWNASYEMIFTTVDFHGRVRTAAWKTRLAPTL